jgi:hypothetical protein
MTALAKLHEDILKARCRARTYSRTPSILKNLGTGNRKNSKQRIATLDHQRDVDFGPVYFAFARAAHRSVDVNTSRESRRIEIRLLERGKPVLWEK